MLTFVTTERRDFHPAFDIVVVGPFILIYFHFSEPNWLLRRFPRTGENDIAGGHKV